MRCKVSCKYIGKIDKVVFVDVKYGVFFFFFFFFFASLDASALRASAMGLPYAKCKVHLAYRPKKCQQREGHNGKG